MCEVESIRCTGLWKKLWLKEDRQARSSHSCSNEISYEPTKELNAMTSSKDTAGGCSASCSTTVSNPLPNVLMTVKEYDGLVKFIKETADPVKCELIQFLYPLYVYIYLLLLKRKRILEGNVNKYVIKASEDNLKLLDAYLKDAECESLLTIIQLQFQAEVVEK
ncbi:hypothetical protein TNIN_177841 [Trichonephila inaurata madagascariensis]|uniref:TFIID subunit TAF5 NTD2 domain-containing protein n=1 Tax=Trichonephila inaurata madagascariensis TaxID=2747483 RepID=A0A8X7C030_9ARAC|nr:hypothetical protein TNIN_177841 [Trichonephila inaurata madagascariensis]